MKIALRSLSLLYFFFFLLTANAQEEQDFQKALQLFQSQKFEEASKAYEQLLAKGYFSDELHYNLGNAYFQNQQPVKAIINYERALKLNPRNNDARFNLKIVLEEIENDLVEVPEFFLIKIWRSIHTRMSSNTWSICFIILIWLAVLALAYWLLAKERTKKKQAFISGIVALILSLFCFFLSSSQFKWENAKDAAIVTEQLPLRSAPEDNNKAILDLSAGTKLYFVDKIGEWHKIRLINGQLGWLKGEKGLVRI